MIVWAGGEPETAIVIAPFVLIDEDKNALRARRADLAKARQRVAVPVITQVMDHAVSAESWQARIPDDGRFIGGAFVKRGVLSIWKQNTRLNVRRIYIVGRTAKHPRPRKTLDGRRFIGRKRIVMVVDVNQPGDGQLFEVIQADDVPRLRLPSREHGQ